MFMMISHVYIIYLYMIYMTLITLAITELQHDTCMPFSRTGPEKENIVLE